jgi:uncharacterized damage-inducible protein DinB
MTETIISETQKIALEEPWLRGTHTELPAVIRAVLHSLDMAAEDIAKWCGPLTEDEINARPHGLPPIAFHMRHISRSMDRLLCFADGEQLRPEHIAALKREMDPGANREDVFEEFARCIHATKLRVAAYEKADLEAARSVGRKQLPSSVGGLLVHVAEHTQRHVGQAVTTAKVVVGMRGF